MTTTTDRPADHPAPVPTLAPKTIARHNHTAKLEAQLEDLFRRSVRSLLRGRTMKLAPTEKGAPDRLVILPGGAMYLVELKTETGRLSPAQRLWHDRVGQLGTKVHVVYGEEHLLRWVAWAQSQAKN